MIVVWVGASCGPCIALKRALDKAGVTYVTRDAESAPTALREEWRARGWSTPVVESAAGTFSGFIPAKVRTLIDMRR